MSSISCLFIKISIGQQFCSGFFLEKIKYTQVYQKTVFTLINHLYNSTLVTE